MRALCAWDPVRLDARALEGAWHLQDRYALSWWDALIVAAAELAGCPFLLTEELQAGQRLGSLTVVDPLATSPAALE